MIKKKKQKNLDKKVNQPNLSREHNSQGEKVYKANCVNRFVRNHLNSKSRGGGVGTLQKFFVYRNQCYYKSTFDWAPKKD